MKKMNKKGFTIVELVIVIAVIGILATVLIPTFGNVIQNAKDSQIVQAARNAYIQKSAEDKTAIGGDFVYVADGRYVAIKDGNLVLKTGSTDVEIFDTADAAIAKLELPTTTVEKVEGVDTTYNLAYSLPAEAAGLVEVVETKTVQSNS